MTAKAAKAPILPRDIIFNADVMDVLTSLPANSIDMVYADPDYNVGVNYNAKNYKRKFDEYIEWCGGWASLAFKVLKPTGSLFIINYPKNNSYLRVRYLDELFYAVHEYAWVYNTNVGHSPKRFTTAHRTILHCRKQEDSVFYKEQVAVPYQNPTDRRILGNLANGSKGRMPYSWLYFNLVKNISKEKTYHACQIPEELSKTLILSCTKPNDVVFVLFGGSGSEVLVTRRLGRRFITAELDKDYCRMILERLKKNGDVSEKYRLRRKDGSILRPEKRQTKLKFEKPEARIVRL